MMGVIVPVIHILNWEQTKYNVDLCVNNGINKVFLINHSVGYDSLDKLTNFAGAIKTTYPELWVGCNYLQLSTREAMTYVKNLNSKNFTQIDGLWTDNAHISVEDASLNEADLINAHKINGLYFGGVAFKYQKQPKPEDLKWVCENAMKYVDVITTSGPATGVGPSINKIVEIRNYIGDHKLAIASGINKSNIKDFSDYVDYFLVASSITNNSTELIDEKKLIELVNILES